MSQSGYYLLGVSKDVKEARERFLAKLNAPQYLSTFIDVLLDAVGFVFIKLSRKKYKPSFWKTTIVISLITLLIDFLTSLILRETYSTRINLLTYEFLFIVLIYIALIIIKLLTIYLFITLQRIVASIKTEKSILDLESWLHLVCDKKKTLLVSIPIGLFLSAYITLRLTLIAGEFVGFGPLLLFIIGSILGSISVYFIIMILIFFLRMRSYEFALYPNDPSNSEIIKILSRFHSNVIYSIAFGGALITLATAISKLLDPSTFFILVILGWGPLITIFIIGHISFAQIITREKWMTLNNIQNQIIKLSSYKGTPVMSKLNLISKLSDFHDRVKNSRNSLINIGASLTLAGSLILNLVAVLISNLDKIYAIVFK